MKRIICYLCLILVSFSLTGCGQKKALSTDEVKDIVIKDGYSVNNNKSQYAEYDDIQEALIIFNQNQLQFEFYVLNNETNAKNMFIDNCDKLSSEKTDGATETKKSGSNYQQYTLVDDDTYSYISQIGSTMFFAIVDSSEAEDIKRIVNKLGY